MPEMQKCSRLMGDAGLHIQSWCVFAYRGLWWHKHLRATWYTTLPKARGQMKAGFDGGSQTHQYIQIPLLMPSRYERDTADIWEHIYEERADRQADIRMYETLFCWHKRPYWQITINRQSVINVSDWKARAISSRQHKKRVFTCSEVHLQQDTQLLCPERLFPLGVPVWPGVGLGGASLQPQSHCPLNILRPWTQRWSCSQVKVGDNMMHFFLMASHWIWLAEHVQDPCCVGK